MKVYLAGPLFSQAERDWLSSLAARLRADAIECFVPHESFSGTEPGSASVVFAGDLEGMRSCDLMLAWLDGAMVDDGTAAEIGIFSEWVRRGLSGLAYPSELWNPAWLAPLQPQEISDLFQQPVDVEDIYSEVLDNWRNSDCTNAGDKSLEFYTNFYLQDNILPKTDRASMLVSLEARAPFLDNDLVDFVRSLPYQLKYRHGNRKYLLKKSMAGILPPDILTRPKKGFGIPIAEWLRELPISPERLPLENSAWVQQRWRDHRDNKADHRLLLWGCLGLQESVATDVANPG